MKGKIKKLVLLLVLFMSVLDGQVFAQQVLSSGLTSDCIVSQQNTNRNLEGTKHFFRCSRDGSSSVILWEKILALEGRLFAANFGSGVTGVSGKVAFTSGSPDANIDIPAGTTIIPLVADVNILTAVGTFNHLWMQANANLTGSGTSTAGPAVVNARIGDQPFASRVVTTQAYTAAGTAPTTSFELFHLQNINSEGSSTPWGWTFNFYAGGLVMPIVGPASISFYSVATTTIMTFQLRFMWIELPSSTIQ